VVRSTPTTTSSFHLSLTPTSPVQPTRLTPQTPDAAVADIFPVPPRSGTTTTTRPGDTSFIRRQLPELSREPFRQGKSVTIPHQVQDPPHERVRVAVDFDLILRKSTTLLGLPHLRSSLLRKVLRLANYFRGQTEDTPEKWQARTNGVYVVVHCPTSRFYVGETSRTVMHRLREHWHSRFSAVFSSSPTRKLTRSAKRLKLTSSPTCDRDD
jgi:hypothetical protein